MTGPTRTVLREDGSLHLVVDPACAPAVEAWVPRFLAPPASEGGDPPAAVVRVAPASDPGPRPAGEVVFRMYGVEGRVDEGRERVHLESSLPAVSAAIDLAGRRAEVRIGPGEDGATAAQGFTMLTISSALLLGRLGAALVHAAAVVVPGGGCWLLVGDTHAGKTTTTINLARAGWSFLSDDHVVASRAGPEVRVEGWPRPFHVDEGWERGEVVGRRAAVDPLRFGAGPWRRSAPLRGLLFPRVRAGEPTRLEPLHPADSLAALLRQTPWLLSDRRAAPAVLDLLREMATRPAYRLSLGLDSYRDPALLAARCAALAGP